MEKKKPRETAARLAPNHQTLRGLGFRAHFFVHHVDKSFAPGVIVVSDWFHPQILEHTALHASGDSRLHATAGVLDDTVVRLLGTFETSAKAFLHFFLGDLVPTSFIFQEHS